MSFHHMRASVQILIVPFRFISLKEGSAAVLCSKWNVSWAPRQLMGFCSARKMARKATKRSVVGRKRGLPSDTTIGEKSWKLRTRHSSVIRNKNSYSEKSLVCLTPGKFSPNFSLFTTLNLTGWTVTSPGVGMTRIRELGLAAWERFDDHIYLFWMWWLSQIIIRLRGMRSTWSLHQGSLHLISLSKFLD